LDFNFDVDLQEVKDEVRNKDEPFEAMRLGGRLSTHYGARIVIHQLVAPIDCAMAGPRDCLPY
jgi:hypothetical protein